ncbi:MAG: hypothetical protein ABI251_07495 [Mycobacteriaceae bacterium]
MKTIPAEHRPMATLIALLGGSAVIHAVRPQVFAPLIPPALGNPRGWVYASGVAEALCVGLLAAPATRRWGGWASTAVLIGVFPGNLYAVQVAGPSRVKRAAALVRLPLQVPMIRAALTVARAG